MASAMYKIDLCLNFYSYFFYLDIRRIKSLVCKFVSPLDVQALPVWIYFLHKINAFFVMIRVK